MLVPGVADRASAYYVPAPLWTTVDAGSYHTCGIRTDGSLSCWGRNEWGQLGVGDRRDRLVPTRVPAPPGTTWATVATGSLHTCALTKDARLYCWGYGTNGSLGLGDRNDRLAPARVFGRATWTGLTAGGDFTCSSGLCWGMNGWGQLGTGGDGTQLSPAPIATPPGVVWAGGGAGIVAGSRHACGVTTDHRLFCWGINIMAQLGFPETQPGVNERWVPTQVPGTDWAAVAPGRNHTCALTTSGRLWCWGSNGHGQTGLGPQVPSPTRPTKVGDDVYRQVDAGDDTTCATRDVWGVPHSWCWGRNDRAQLGLGDTVDRFVPTDVGISSGLRVATGSWHTCDITSAVYCWGDNPYGQIGDGTTLRRSTPVRIS